jgi:hypothetical protein
MRQKAPKCAVWRILAPCVRLFPPWSRLLASFDAFLRTFAVLGQAEWFRCKLILKFNLFQKIVHEIPRLFTNSKIRGQSRNYPQTIVVHGQLSMDNCPRKSQDPKHQMTPYLVWTRNKMNGLLGSQGLKGKVLWFI